MRKFASQQACIELLERIRWKGRPACPICGSLDVERKKENDLIGRWNCHDCTSSFKVTSGTIFNSTKIELPKWFAAIAILLNAKKSVSSCQLARDLDLNQKTAWYMAMRIRKAMKEDSDLLQGIVEADETYLGGKTRGKNRIKGRDKRRKAVLGVVERKGRVRATVSPRVTAKFINAFLRRNVNPRSVLMTDAFPGYNEVSDWIKHLRINHSVAYVDGIIHTNTIESFWALVKRAITGQYHHYTVKHAPAYIDEATYKYNTRKSETPFADFMLRAVGVIG